MTIPRGVATSSRRHGEGPGSGPGGAAAAAATGGSGVLVNLGGDIAVAGSPPPGLARCGSPTTTGPADTPGQSLTIDSGGLATSSTTVRRRGLASHHIIDR